MDNSYNKRTTTESIFAAGSRSQADTRRTGAALSDMFFVYMMVLFRKRGYRPSRRNIALQYIIVKKKLPMKESPEEMGSLQSYF